MTNVSKIFECYTLINTLCKMIIFILSYEAWGRIIIVNEKGSNFTCFFGNFSKRPHLILIKTNSMYTPHQGLQKNFL